MSLDANTPRIIEVVAGVLMRPDGSYMLGSRPEGKPYAGYWEFPGGKVEAGESFEQALARELDEEMGIRMSRASFWLTRVHHYEHASVRLHFFRVWDWQGEPRPLEGQRFAWMAPGTASVEPMLPANGPILKALALPFVYAVTCAHLLGEAAILRRLSEPDAPQLVLVREPGLAPAELARFTAAVAERVHDYGGRVLLHGDTPELEGLPVDGVHLPARQLAACTVRPDVPWVGASVHNAGELARAGELGFDYALLGHVQPTDSHPGQSPLGWEGFEAIRAATTLPVYALGGLNMRDLDLAQRHGAHGVALMRGAWA
ncbi:Nudix family hydrolase [Paludibacterium purpuratum]|uniref:8-oxo-dGTP diphosphatase n=1 Tax=Paludibacterium purpuratum TaxID=1144873 RepID=A0A4R7B9F5_9NEIS|nr:Nudix family hydrolase [Paludibacterium purpuratum]TDR81448.1 8-oxo-dGTP diphosphatase [Paludibacterium purpuratum]